MTCTNVHILIVEQDADAALLLQVLLEKHGFIVAGIFDNGREVLDFLTARHVDLIIIDIKINGPLDGIETALEINKIRCVPIVYLTAYSGSEVIERARKTFPAAYILKPCAGDSLILTIEIAIKNFENAGVVESNNPGIYDEGKKEKITVGEAILSAGPYRFIKQNYKYVRINIEEVTYLESQDKFTYIHTLKAKYTLRKSLQDVLEEIKDTFLVRVHRSFAVNIMHLTSFSEKQVIIGKNEFPLGNQYKEYFLKQFSSNGRSTPPLLKN